MAVASSTHGLGFLGPLHPAARRLPSFPPHTLCSARSLSSATSCLSIMNESAPPSYNDDMARAELKRKFTTLVKDQQDIQDLFKTIARELQATPEIGDKHPLLNEWDVLREVSTEHTSCVRYRDCEASSQCVRRDIDRHITSLDIMLHGARDTWRVRVHIV